MGQCSGVVQAASRKCKRYCGGYQFSRSGNFFRQYLCRWPIIDKASTCHFCPLFHYKYHTLSVSSNTRCPDPDSLSPFLNIEINRLADSFLNSRLICGFGKKPAWKWKVKVQNKESIPPKGRVLELSSSEACKAFQFSWIVFI